MSRPTSASGDNQHPDGYSVLITETVYPENNDFAQAVTSHNIASATRERSRGTASDRKTHTPRRSPSRQENEEADKDKAAVTKKLTLKKPKMSRTLQKDAVLDAVHYMEKENQQLQRATHHLMDDMEKMRKENEKLRKEVESLRYVKETWSSRIEKLENDNRRLNKEVEIRVTKFKEETKRRDVEYEEMSKENDDHVKLIQSLEKDLELRRRDLLKRGQEIEKLKEKLDVSYRRNFDDHRLELLHELEQLKTQKRDFFVEREKIEREHQKLQEEFKVLEGKLSQQEAELKNENRRHSLLTKEFNSLLEENNRLKLQLRRRTSLNIKICPASKESLNEGVTDVSPGTRKKKRSPEMGKSVALYMTDRRSPTSGKPFPTVPTYRIRKC